MTRKLNFSSGPAVLPEQVLRRAPLCMQASEGVRKSPERRQRGCHDAQNVEDMPRQRPFILGQILAQAAQIAHLERPTRRLSATR